MAFRINERLASTAQLRDLKATLLRFGCGFHRDERPGLVCTVPDDKLCWGVAGGLAAYLEAFSDIIVWSDPAPATGQPPLVSDAFTVPWQLTEPVHAKEAP